MRFITLWSCLAWSSGESLILKRQRRLLFVTLKTIFFSGAGGGGGVLKADTMEIRGFRPNSERTRVTISVRQEEARVAVDESDKRTNTNAPLSDSPRQRGLHSQADWGAVRRAESSRPEVCGFYLRVQQQQQQQQNIDLCRLCCRSFSDIERFVEFLHPTLLQDALTLGSCFSCSVGLI